MEASREATSVSPRDYEYATDDTNKVEQVAKLINERSTRGWEFVQCVAGVGAATLGGRWLLIFRRLRDE